METKILHDGAASFEVSVRGPDSSATSVLFAVGAGGNPERHATLLDTLAAEGCFVIAPHFDRLASTAQSEWLAENMPDRENIEIQINEGAGHFSYMGLPPPHIADAMPNKTEFLNEHARVICEFLSS